MLESTMLMLDEPSAGLNRGERENLARLILRIKRKLDFAMMRLERDMQIVAELADRSSLPHIWVTREDEQAMTLKIGGSGGVQDSEFSARDEAAEMPEDWGRRPHWLGD